MRWGASARGLRSLALACAVVAGAAALTPDSRAEGAPEDGAIRLRVMSFNIWYGGFRTGLDGVTDAIRAAGADVVGLQEPYSNTRRIARRLGWYAAPRLHTISRFPIAQPAGSRGLWGYLLVGEGRVVAIANNHNICCPYGPNLIRVGWERDEVLRVEQRLRIRWQQPFLDALAPLIEAGQPVFFTGDFNSPSWRDWTPEVVRAQGWQPPSLRAKGPRYAVRWPVSVAIEAAGFRDSYREAHPDPLADPGYTWTPGHPGLSPWDIFDRIDFVWAAGPAETLSSRVVGEDGPYTDVVSEPWPSDHRAVVSAFRVTPAMPGTFVATIDVPAPAGRALRGAFHAEPAPGRRIGIWPTDADPANDPPLADVPIDDAASDGIVSLPTDGRSPGVYALALVAGDGSVLSRAVFDLVDPDAPARISVSERRYGLGEPIVVSWENGPGNRYDWLSVNEAGVNPAVGKLWQWRYVDGRAFGTARITAEAVGNWPLPPGRWQVHLCVDDDYVCIASSEPFRVVAA